MDLSGLRILVLDDSPENLMAFRRAIEHLGGDCFAAGTIAEAKRLLVHSKPDVCIIDFVLCNGQGLGVIHELEADSPGLGYILTSAFDLPAAAELAVPFLPKPFELSQLYEAVMKSIGRTDTDRPPA